MNFEPENYIWRALLWFAALVSVTGWVAVVAVIWGVCIMIEWVTA